ncbi:hypothetical protein QU960_13040, partial [Escherichia coli]|nr:hypothetical protein [Escherichia coli]
MADPVAVRDKSRAPRSGERDNFAPHMALVPMVIEQTSRGE